MRGVVFDALDASDTSAFVEANFHFGEIEFERTGLEAGGANALGKFVGVMEHLLYGSAGLALKNREFVFNHTSKDATTYESLRRSIYLPIIRNHVYDQFEQFDYPDPAVPTGSRNETVIAPQALLMMNAELVGQSAERLAKQVLASPGLNDRQRLEQIYRRAYSRPPSVRELERAKSFLDEFEQTAAAKRCEPSERRWQAWTTLCHAVLAANEFVYLN